MDILFIIGRTFFVKIAKIIFDKCTQLVYTGEGKLMVKKIKTLLVDLLGFSQELLLRKENKNVRC